MGGMRATPPMGWTTPQAEVLPRQEKGSVLVVGPEQETGASRWREDKARGVRLHRRALRDRGASAYSSQLKNGRAR